MRGNQADKVALNVTVHHWVCHSLFESLQGWYSMLTHVYPHKPLRKIELTICNHQADSPLYVLPDVWCDDLQVHKKYGWMSRWDQVWLNNTKPNQTSIWIFLVQVGLIGCRTMQSKLILTGFMPCLLDHVQSILCPWDICVNQWTIRDLQPDTRSVTCYKRALSLLHLLSHF